MDVLSIHLDRKGDRARFPADRWFGWISVLAVFAVGAWLRIDLLGEPARFDEARSYMSFAAEGPGVVLTAYDAPNNHVFYNLLSWVTSSAVPPGRVSIRLPALLAGLGSILAVFFLARSRWGWAAGLAGAAILAFGSRQIEYSAQGRGYSLTVLCFLLAWGAIDRLGRAPPAESRWTARIVLVIASVIGLWTVPTMMFALVPIFLWWPLWWWLHRRSNALTGKSALLEMAACGCVVACLALLAYTPILLDSGWASLAGNRFVAPLEWSDWRERLGQLIDHGWAHATRDGSSVGIVLAVVVGAGWLAVTQGVRSMSWSLGGCLLVGITGVMAFTRSVPPERVLLFLSAFAALVAAEAAGACAAWWKSRLSARESRSVPVGGLLAFAALGISALGVWGHDRGAIARSLDAGGYPDADRLADLWQEQVAPGENFVVGAVAKTPLWFLDTVEDIPVKIGVRDPATTTWVVVARRYGETPKQVLRASGLGSRAPFEEFRWGQVGDCSVYRLPAGVVSRAIHSWADAVFVDARCRSPWFGVFHDYYYPWIAHERHGDLRVEVTEGEPGVWFWDDGLKRWWWTRSDCYPAVLVYLEGPVWLWFDEASAVPDRRFFDPRVDRWLSSNDLRGDDDKAAPLPALKPEEKIPPDDLRPRTE